jgi:peptidoglycan/xylan/chitin deacetylase (PgdA/CDA1 family)
MPALPYKGLPATMRTEHCAELNDSRRRYVQRFVASQGFDSSTLNDDLLAAFFRMLARVDEYEVLQKCESDYRERRFLSLSRHGEIPVRFVDSLSRRTESPVPFIDLKLRELEAEGKLRRLENVIPLWPDGRRFALVLTHDVDSVPGVYTMPRLRALRAIPRAPLKRKMLLLLSAAKGLSRSVLPIGHNAEGSFESWLDEEARYGFRSSFFFFAGDPPARNWRDAFYRQYDQVAFEGYKRPISSVMKVMADRGWDVGLHGSSLSWSDPELLRKERAGVETAIGRTVRTIRQHHLLFDIRYTPAFHRQAGFEADSTLGSNASVGFRCGTCYPFKIYDLWADCELDLLEAPLIVQEAALLKQESYDESRAYERCRELMERIASINGVLTLLWHNNVARSSPEFRVYSALLAHAERLGAWGCSLVQLNDWWRRRTAELL